MDNEIIYKPNKATHDPPNEAEITRCKQIDDTRSEEVSTLETVISN